MDLLTVIAITLVAAIIVAVAQYQFKRNLEKFHFNKGHLIKLVKNKGILIGVGLYIISLLVYLVALHYGQLSFVYPTFASSFIFITLVSKYALKERVTLARACGILLILAGIAMVALTYQ